MSQDLQTIAVELSHWFERNLELCDQVLFIGGDEAHRQAAVLGTITHNARLLVHREVDASHALHTPLVLLLAAICRRLELRPAPQEWLAALGSVLELGPRVEAAQEAAPWLVEGGVVQVFKRHMGEALVQAGMTDSPTILARDNRRLALGLALNWGMRMLVANALHEIRTEKHELTELCGILEPLKV